MSEMLFDLQRFAVIRNYRNDTLVSGTNGNDSIYNEGDRVTIEGGLGNLLVITLQSSAGQVTTQLVLEEVIFWSNTNPVTEMTLSKG